MLGLFGKKTYEDMPADEFRIKIQEDKNAILLDVRTVGEFNSGRIPKAINFDIMSSNFSEKIQALDKNKIYYVYCQGGSRSGQACHFMNQNGFTAINLAGGIMRWRGKVVR